MPRRRFWYWLIPGFLAVALYAISLWGTYIYDDVFFAKDDPRLHHPHEWIRFFREGYMDGGIDRIWRPLVSMSFALEVWGHGDRPWVFHLINVLLHGIVSAMVAVLAARLASTPDGGGDGANGRRIGLIAGLLFAALPIHVEAVAGIVGRAEEMAAIGILAALLLFIDRPITIARALTITGAFLFAAFSKEQGLLVPLLLLAWGLAGKRKSERPAEAPDDGSSRRATPWLAVLLLGTLAAYITYRNAILPWYWERDFLDPAMNPLVQSRGVDRWLIPVAILGRYAAMLVVPTGMSVDYSMNVFTPRFQHDGYFDLGLLALAAGCTLAAVAWVRRWRAVLFCIAGFALLYLMISNLVIIGTVFAERLIYLPSIFFCIFVTLGLSRVRAAARWPIVGVLLALASVRTVTHVALWNDPPRLYRYSLRSQPKASQAFILLASDDLDRGDARGADEVLAEARRVVPESWQVWFRSALAKMALGQYDQAQQFAREAFRLRPGNVEVLGAMEKINAELDRRATTRPAK